MGRLIITEENTIAKTADVIRNICHSRDVAIVIEDHFLFMQKHGLDGVHLSDGARNVRKARKELGKEAIVGAFCGNSKHNGITAGEAGDDYISFGPLSNTTLKDGTNAKNNVYYEAECCVSNVAVSVAAAEVIETRIDFVTNGVIALKTGDTPGYLLQEDDDKILQENESPILLEQV